MARFVTAALLATVASAAIEQIHITYTGIPGRLAVDFVSTVAGSAAAHTSIDGGRTWLLSPATSLDFPTIGYLGQAALEFTGVAPGAKAQYFITAAGSNSSVYEVTPIVARPERFAVFGDFGLAEDICMDDLIAQAGTGAFDSVLHVGDWAYNFEDLASTVGNSFMNDIQGYAATHPVMPVEGNHEKCSKCNAIPGLKEESLNNFTHYKGRMLATALLGAGNTSGTGTARYYSFNQGLTHFLVFSAEAYLYARDEAFLANQLNFMEADLAAVDRTVTPWVVALVHKDYTMEAEAYAAFSPILNKGKVNILFCGYNRFMPVDAVTGAVDTAAVSADGSTYTNAKYMTIIVTGASGDHEGETKYVKSGPSYTGSSNYGWGIYTALSATSATWEWHTVKADGAGPADFSDKLTWVKN